jgi:hypothetical protein
MKGIAFGSDFQCLTSLARMIEGIEKSSLFKNAKLVSADENKSYNRPAVGFEIICDMEHESNPPSSPSVSSRTDLTKEGPGGLAGEKK